MTNVFYYSNRSKPCAVILQRLETLPHIRSMFQYVSVDSKQPSHGIRSVPAIVVESKVYEGKQVFEWLEKEQHNNTLPAFEQGFGTNNFTSIHRDNAAAENNHNFTYIEEEGQAKPAKTLQTPQTPQTPQKQQKIGDNALDELISQRKMEIPIPRQRS
jgi:hypothetical protein